MRALPVRGGAVWQLVGLITRRSQVRILPPLPANQVICGVGALKLVWNNQGPRGPFLFPEGGGRRMASLQDRLVAMLDPLVESLGYELVLLEFNAHRGSALVRLFIDAVGGVTLGDCERV